jgi:hypothetical protein
MTTERLFATIDAYSDQTDQENPGFFDHPISDFG